MTDKLCGNCKCYTPHQFHAETGRCRKYNITVGLRTQCLNNPHWKCRCLNNNKCMERKKHKKENNIK